MDENADLNDRLDALVSNVNSVIVGKEKAVELAIITLLCRGHLLIEDVPGVGKTMLAKTIARSVAADFKRIQFTPDLLPADISGVSVYNQQHLAFEFHPGPVFTNIVLGDEINRATPRTQSSLLECMEERQVTVDGVTRKMAELFFVVATQNPIELQGTFTLPEAQLDRFLTSISLDYPSEQNEIRILDAQAKIHPIETIQPVIAIGDILQLQDQLGDIFIDDAIKKYIVQVVRKTRIHKDVELGASPRASLALARASRAYALLRRQEYVSPQMIKDLAPAVLKHRLIIDPRSQFDGLASADVVNDILNSVDVPIK